MAGRRDAGMPPPPFLALLLLATLYPPGALGQVVGLEQDTNCLDQMISCGSALVNRVNSVKTLGEACVPFEDYRQCLNGMKSECFYVVCGIYDGPWDLLGISPTPTVPEGFYRVNITQLADILEITLQQSLQQALRDTCPGTFSGLFAQAFCNQVAPERLSVPVFSPVVKPPSLFKAEAPPPVVPDSPPTCYAHMLVCHREAEDQLAKAMQMMLCNDLDGCLSHAEGEALLCSAFTAYSQCMTNVAALADVCDELICDELSGPWRILGLDPDPTKLSSLALGSAVERLNTQCPAAASSLSAVCTGMTLEAVDPAPSARRELPNRGASIYACMGYRRGASEASSVFEWPNGPYQFDGLKSKTLQSCANCREIPMNETTADCYRVGDSYFKLQCYEKWDVHSRSWQKRLEGLLWHEPNCGRNLNPVGEPIWRLDITAQTCMEAQVPLPYWIDCTVDNTGRAGTASLDTFVENYFTGSYFDDRNRPNFLLFG